MSEVTLLESRLSKIERDNRRLKLTVGALLLVLAAVPLIGAVMPEQIPDLIQARRFEVIDENDNFRAVMTDTGIHYRDENEDIRASMGTNGIGYYDGNGKIRVGMTPFGFWYYDENGKIRVGMGIGGISYWDENQTLRTSMGTNGIHYVDENGNLVWSTICAPNC